MISSTFSNKSRWLLLMTLLAVSSVNAELVNVGPTDRVYENLLFDGYIKSGDKTLNILSGVSDDQQDNINGYGIWKSNLNATNNWKFTPTNSWQNAAVINYSFQENDIRGKPDKIITDRNTSDTNTNDPTTAKFIWAANPGGSENGRNGPEKAYFSYNFNLDNTFFDAKNTLSASAKVLADDFFAMSVNGHFVKNGLLDTQIASNTAENGLGLPVDVDFSKWLKDGNNTISIFAYDGYKVNTQDIIEENLSILVKVENTNTDTYPDKITSSFIPSAAINAISITDAADILGYDHFNWFQVMTAPGQSTPSSLCKLKYCIDPSSLMKWPDNQYTDNEVFYWDEDTDKFSYIDNIINNTMLSYWDSPKGNLKNLTFDTFLVGILDNKKWNPIYHFNWTADRATIANGDQKVSLLSQSEILDLNTIDPEVIKCMISSGANIIDLNQETNKNTCFYTVNEPPAYLLIMLGFILMNFINTKNIIKI